jgi:SUKH superfamily protein
MIDELLKIMPPPAQPRHNKVLWQDVYVETGLRFPQDYRWFIEAYGSGAIDSYLTVFDTHRYAENDIAFWTLCQATLEEYRSVRLQTQYQVPFPIFPEPEGLVPCGLIKNGHSINWLTKGSPDDWTIVFYDWDHVQFTHFDMCLVDFIFGWIRGSILPHDKRLMPIFEQDGYL